MRLIATLILILASVWHGLAQDKTKMDFESYNPPSTLVVAEHKLTKAKYPFIDVHNHQWSMSQHEIEDVVKDMDT